MNVPGGSQVVMMTSPSGANATAMRSGVTPPVLALDIALLTSLARSSGLVENLPPDQRPLLYKVYMNEVSEIVAIRQVRGPKVPAVENELMLTRVVSPGIRGAEPVPVVFYLEVRVP